MCSPVRLLPSLIQCMRPVRGSLSATAAAGRVGFGRRGSRTHTVGGRLRHLGRWLRTQCSTATSPCPFACRRSCVISRLCTCCRWVMSHTTCVSRVSDSLRSPRWPRRTCGMKSFQAYRISPVSACPAASRAQMRAQISLPACWFISASMTARSGAQWAREHLIRSSGHIVQDRPLQSVRWADIPQLSIRGRCCPPSWQQYWQQPQCSRRMSRPS
jgi:hypothetical protein